MASIASPTLAVAKQAEWIKPFDTGFPITSKLWNRPTSENVMLGAAQRACFAAAAAFMFVIEAVKFLLANAGNGVSWIKHETVNYFANKKVEEKKPEAPIEAPIAAAVEKAAPAAPIAPAEAAPVAPAVKVPTIDGAPAAAVPAAAPAAAAAIPAAPVAPAPAAPAAVVAPTVKKCPPMMVLLARAVAAGNVYVWQPVKANVWQPTKDMYNWTKEGVVDLTKLGWSKVPQIRTVHAAAAPAPAPVAAAAAAPVAPAPAAPAPAAAVAPVVVAGPVAPAPVAAAAPVDVAAPVAPAPVAAVAGDVAAL